MKKLLFLLTLGILFAACETNPLSTTNPNDDETPPFVSLRGSAVPPEGGPAAVEEVTGDNPLGGASKNMNAQAGSAIAFVCDAEDPEGVEELKIWNIGFDFNDPTTATYFNANPVNAFANIRRSGTMTPQPGQKIQVYATARNFGGGFFGTTTAATGRLTIQASGNQPALPPNVQSTTLNFTFNNSTKFYETFNDPVPFGPPATIVGVEVANPFAGSFISLYHGPQANATNLNIYAECKRLLPNTRVDMLNGPWVAGHWYGLRGARTSSSQAGNLSITVYYTQ